MGTEIRLAAFALLVVAGLWLIGDAMTYALHPLDPASGKPRGCYTKLDLLLGVGPSESGILAGTRALELVMGIPLVLFGSARFARTFWQPPSSSSFSASPPLPQPAIASGNVQPRHYGRLLMRRLQ